MEQNNDATCAPLRSGDILVFTTQENANIVELRIERNNALLLWRNGEQTMRIHNIFASRGHYSLFFALCSQFAIILARTHGLSVVRIPEEQGHVRRYKLI